MNNNFEFSRQNIKEKFLEIYGDSSVPVRIFASPARINIIGEHIDYNGGKVFPTAINKYLFCAIRKRSDYKIIYKDLFFPGTYEFSINDDFTFNKQNDYANYLNGILSSLKKRGAKFSSGFEVLLLSQIPSAAGISSSSALECGFTFGICQLFDFTFSRKEIALIGQQSEHEFMNVNCGIMDQYIIATAKENTAELLDCAKIEHEYIPLNLGDYVFVVMNTNKKRKLTDSKYNERRSECEKGLSILQNNGVNIENLCSLTNTQLDDYSLLINEPTILKRVRHCVTENKRVIDSVEALKQNNLKLLGQYLIQSHKSLKEDYEVTGIELDTLVDSALKQKSCIGARMTGAGFGGCAIALVKKDEAQSFMNIVQKEYKNKIGYDCQLFTCSTSNGVKEV